MPTATIVITVDTSKYMPDATALTRVDAVDLSRDLQHPALGSLTIGRNTTIVHAPGVIRRTLEIILSADFLAAYPTVQLQESALAGLFVPTLKAKLPTLRVTSTTAIR